MYTEDHATMYASRYLYGLRDVYARCKDVRADAAKLPRYLQKIKLDIPGRRLSFIVIEAHAIFEEAIFHTSRRPEIKGINAIFMLFGTSRRRDRRQPAIREHA